MAEDFTAIPGAEGAKGAVVELYDRDCREADSGLLITIRCFNPGPECTDSCACFGRDGENFFDAKSLFERCQIARSLVAAEAVDFGCDDYEVAAHVTQPVDELTVAVLRRNIGIDETDAETEGFPFREIGLDEFWPFRRDRL